MHEQLKQLIKEFYEYAKEQLNLQDGIKIVLKYDEENAKDPLGKTAYYVPDENKIVLYASGRHPKDITRSLSHEIWHCYQRQNGEFEGIELEDNIQSEAMKKIEGDCYKYSNLLFRRWTENKKHNVQH